MYDVLCVGLLWCQGDHYNKAEQLFEFTTPLGYANNAYSKYSDNVDEADDAELIEYSEMWDLIILTLFEIASHTMVELCFADNKSLLDQKRVEPQMRAMAAKILSSRAQLAQSLEN